MALNALSQRAKTFACHRGHGLANPAKKLVVQGLYRSRLCSMLICLIAFCYATQQNERHSVNACFVGFIACNSHRHCFQMKRTPRDRPKPCKEPVRALPRVDAQEAYNSVVTWCRRTTALGVLPRARLLLRRNLPH